MDQPLQIGLEEPRRGRAALALWTGLVAVSIELMGVNVLLPAISQEFAVSPADATWLVTVYQFCALLTLLPLSALGEVFGYKRVYRAGLVVYLAGALCCKLAPDFWLLVGGRALQGLGIAGIVSVNGALVRHVFPQESLTRALAVNSMIVAIFGALGPSIASTAIALGSWLWLFLVSAPLCLLSLAWGWRSLPANPLAASF